MAPQVSASCFAKTQDCACSTPSIITVACVALALAVLGGLALYGALYPSTPIGALGLITQTGGTIMICVGGTGGILLLAVRFCCWKKETPNEVQTLQAQLQALQASLAASREAPGAAPAPDLAIFAESLRLQSELSARQGAQILALTEELKQVKERPAPPGEGAVTREEFQKTNQKLEEAIIQLGDEGGSDKRGAGHENVEFA